MIGITTTTNKDAPRFLMCAPEFFGVEYVINPWMAGKEGSVGAPLARAQWGALYTLLTQTLGAIVETVAPQPGLPDLVFTANAATVRGRLCVPARFRFPERQGEEPQFRDFFDRNGYTISDLPDGIAFEGAGDALWWEPENATEPPVLWAAYGPRSDPSAHTHLARIFGAEVVSLMLTDDRFYHLDTCFCPLPGGFLLWYPPAFGASRAQIENAIAADKRIAVSDRDAEAFACNAVSIGKNVVMNAAGDLLRAWLGERGFAVYTTPLSEFMKSGGAAKCLTLRLL